MAQTDIKKISKLTLGSASGMVIGKKMPSPPKQPSLDIRAVNQSNKVANAISCGCSSCHEEEEPVQLAEQAMKADIHCGCGSCETSIEAPIANTEKFSMTHKLALSALLAALAETAHWLDYSIWLSGGLALCSIFLSGIKTYQKGWKALRQLDPNMHALMSIAVTGAALIGQWPEAAMVMVLFNIAELLESRSVKRARNAIQSLMKLSPEHALVKQPNGEWKSTETNLVRLGAIIRIKPGMRIPLDGIIQSGNSTIDQAPVTGESMPVEKNPDDIVYAGTINQNGAFEYRVTAGANQTVLAKIIHSVEEAQEKRAPIQRLVDRFARVYTPIILILGLGVAIIPPLFMNGEWLSWIYKALVLLVIGCPCALVLSTPVAIVTALSVAARHGVLIKGGHFLESGRKLSVIAMDKTGTLTAGKPVVTDFVVNENSNANSIRNLAVSLASHSDHPVSQAIVNHFFPSSLLPLQTIHAETGVGIRAITENSDVIALSNPAVLSNSTIKVSEHLKQQIESFAAAGKTLVLFVLNEQVAAVIAVADTVKATSKAAIDHLKKLNVSSVMLTGDHAVTANAIGQEVGIDQVFSEQLPNDKLAQIKNLTQKQFVGMVGDGINDAPALAQANIGFAMGGMGSDTAIETADITLMDDDLRKIPFFIRLSQATWRNMMQNIAAALGIKLIFLIMTLMGIGTLWMAVFADVGTSLLVVGNAMRLLRFH